MGFNSGFKGLIAEAWDWTFLSSEMCGVSIPNSTV
jgi:hypothetical protein